MLELKTSRLKLHPRAQLLLRGRLGRTKSSRGVPTGEMYWQYVSRERKRAHHKLVTARRRQSVKQRRGVRV